MVDFIFYVLARVSSGLITNWILSIKLTVFFQRKHYIQVSSIKADRFADWCVPSLWDRLINAFMNDNITAHTLYTKTENAFLIYSSPFVSCSSRFMAYHIFYVHTRIFLCTNFSGETEGCVCRAHQSCRRDEDWQPTHQWWYHSSWRHEDCESQPTAEAHQ